ncbi:MULTISPECIES: IclR family transcriptional regulator [Amycolatopsis]|uniref:IclR family transcriptional regulator n=1 Tax=Amycolatopsis thermalba TaxID=944492 RepID=A0ABY4P127_9PSEU|nr:MULTISPECIES: IclR family transcriptional regulator [Amycolatopsis]OXM64645.1 IclR family transcriptional regulator [Amycolatopsis sp. KNN50.9b]UQS25936.1 IclR family transcriptional regulator [Amycolatopsis thermalba]
MRNNERSTNGSASQVQSVDRAIAILDILARRGEAGVTEIAQELDVHKSTAFRLVGALEAWQLVEQVSERGKYRLGFGIVRLAGATTARLDLSRESRAVCERLAAELDETVNVAVVDQGQATNIMQVYGSAAVTARNWIGQRTPLHATSSGKVLLAWAADDVREAALAELTPFTPNTRTDRAKLTEELAQVRERGWACTVEELEVGLNAVAAPIRAANGDVIAALSVSGPAYRMEPSSYADVAEKIVAGAEEISFRVGYLGPR